LNPRLPNPEALFRMKLGDSEWQRVGGVVVRGKIGLGGVAALPCLGLGLLWVVVLDGLTRCHME